MTYSIEKATGSLSWRIVDGDKLVRRYRTKRTATAVLRVYNGDASAITAVTFWVWQELDDGGDVGATCVRACRDGWLGVDPMLSQEQRDSIAHEVWQAFGRLAVATNGGRPVTLNRSMVACDVHPYLGKLREVERHFDGEKLYDIVLRGCHLCPGDVSEEKVDSPVAVQEDTTPTPMFEYPIIVPVDPAFALDVDEANRGAFRVVREWGWETPGPSITWHEWAAPVAERVGAARGWSLVAGQTIDDRHRHYARVREILLHASVSTIVSLPTGIVALDLRGLHAVLAWQTFRLLLTEARRRAAAGEHTRGAIFVVEAHAAALIFDTLPDRHV